MDELLKGVANYGFPIIVSVYLLVRMESKMDTLQAAIVELTHAVERISQK